MKRIILYSICLLPLIIACTERIDVNLDETYTRLVVYGHIANDTGKYRISLTKTADYFYNEPAPCVVNATVVLSNGLDQVTLHETNQGISGIYETDSLFAGIIGQTYTLDIELSGKINNETHYSSSCKMMQVTRLDSIQIVFQPDWGEKGFWEIKVFAQEPGDEVNYYMFQYYRNDTLMTDSIMKVFYADDSFINGNYINGHTAVYIDNEHFWETLHPGDKVSLQMSGITKAYYDFLYQVQMAGLNIPFFTGPPANVEGNISNGAVGFFAAYSNSWANAIVK